MKELSIRENTGGYLAAPLWKRAIASLGDMAIEAGITLVITILLFPDLASDLPPRYWNMFDYFVDLYHLRPDLFEIPAVIFATTFIIWETTFVRLIGSAPISRLMGMRILTGRGGRPGLIRCFIRSILALSLTVAALIGPVTGLVSPKRRMLHDIFTGCYVVLDKVLE